MDEMTINYTTKLLTEAEGISSFLGIRGIVKRFPLFVLSCRCYDQFQIEFVSDNISIFNYDAKSLNGGVHSLSDFIPEKEFYYFRSTFQKYAEKGERDFSCQLEFLDAVGEMRTVLCHVDIIYVNDLPSRIECLFVDITHISLHSAEYRRTRTIINNSDLVFIQQKANERGELAIEFASDNLSNYVYSKNEFFIEHRDISDILHTDDRTIYESQLKCINPDGCTYYTNTFRVVLFQTQVTWALFETLVHAENGMITMVETIIHDITDEKESASKLFESQKVLTNSLKRNQLVTEILKLLQVSDDYFVSLKILMQKLSQFANITTLKILIPKKSKTADEEVVYHSFSYDNKARFFNESEIYISDIVRSYPNITARVANYGMVYCDAFGCSKGCEEEFHRYGSNSNLMYTFSMDSGEIGYIIFSDDNHLRAWDNEIITLVSDFSQIISGMFHRYSIEDQLLSTKDSFKTVLDNIDAYVCVTSINTDKIVFTNKKFNDNFGKNSLGKNFWDILNIDKKDLSLLDNEKNYINTLKKPYFFEVFSYSTNQWLDITEIAVKWNDGSVVKLFTISDITQKVEYEKLIEKQALNDHLTELPNRRMLERDFPKLLEDTLSRNGYGYILFLDLDNFKNVNDGLGHQYGDALLLNIAQFLKGLEYTGKFTYRFGGDEFIILIPYEYCDEMENTVNTLFERFRSEWNVLDTSYFCTVSIGIANFPNDGTNLFDIMKKVDMAMYSAKKNGKNRAIHYKSKIGSDSIRSIELERYLRESVSNNFSGFRVFYQPVINTQTKKLEGAEALLRWSCENLGSISPVEFIPIAEDLGLIVHLGNYVLRQSCVKCKEWIHKGYTDFKMNVNLSVGQLTEPNIVDMIHDTITEIEIPFSNIGFEVTESLAINDMNRMKEVLHSISSLGIDISLDDFGTGYSSLINIKEMPLSTIKIDKSFIDDLMLNSNTEIFVKMIIELAHALNIRVCAEGVEEEYQYNRLLELNADIIQGYYFGKPIPADEFEKKFEM